MCIGRRVLASVVAATYLAACTSWRVQSLTPESAGATHREMRVTGPDGNLLVLHDARMVGDSVIGYTDRPIIGWTEHGGRAALPLTQVTRAETRGFDAVKTTLLVLCAGGLVLAVVNGLKNFTTAE